MFAATHVTTWYGLSITDWGTLGTALFTAVAAAAALGTVLLDRRRQQAATIPNVTASLYAVQGNQPHQYIEATNAGPGIAIGLLYFGVDAGRKFGGFFAKATLLPGERTRAVMPAGFVAGDSANFIWSCRDSGGRFYTWSHHGGRNVETPSSAAWPSGEQVFTKMYPDVVVPRGDTLTFVTE